MINSFHCLFNNREHGKVKSHNCTASIRVSLNIFVVLKEQYDVCQGLERLLNALSMRGNFENIENWEDSARPIFREVVEKVESVLCSCFKSTG